MNNILTSILCNSLFIKLNKSFMFFKAKLLFGFYLSKVNIQMEFNTFYVYQVCCVLCVVCCSFQNTFDYLKYENAL